MVFFRVKIRAPLSCVQSGWNLAQESILRCWFWIWDKKSDTITFWGRTMPFFTKNWKFRTSAPWQKRCHGNTPDYCRLKTILNDALYKFTKSQKFHQPTANVFQHSKAKTCKGHNAPPPPAWIGLKLPLSRSWQVIEFGYLPPENGFNFYKMRFHVQNRSLRSKSDPSCQFEQFPRRGNCFQFQKFFRLLYEKRAAATHLVDKFCYNFVRASRVDSRYVHFNCPIFVYEIHYK